MTFAEIYGLRRDQNPHPVRRKHHAESRIARTILAVLLPPCGAVNPNCHFPKGDLEPVTTTRSSLWRGGDQLIAHWPNDWHKTEQIVFQSRQDQAAIARLSDKWCARSP